MTSGVSCAGTRTDLLDLIRRYRQPHSAWMHTTPRLLDLHGMQLSADETLVDLPHSRIDEASTFWDSCQAAGIECYEEDELPKRRRSFWTKHLSPTLTW